MARTPRRSDRRREWSGSNGNRAGAIGRTSAEHRLLLIANTDGHVIANVVVPVADRFRLLPVASQRYAESLA